MSSIRISHPLIYKFKEIETDGELKFTDEGLIESFVSKERKEIDKIIFKSNEIISFNYIRITHHKEFSNLAPSNFRFEISMDGSVWEPIIRETQFQFPKLGEYTWHFSLIQARFVKFIMYSTQTKKTIALGKIEIGISGIIDIKVSSQLDRLWVKENLIDERKEYGWSSSLKKEDTEEFIEVDLGSINRVTEIRLLSRNYKDVFFPASFQMIYSEDKITWHHLVEENVFFAEPGTWYRWKFYPINMRFFKIVIKENAMTREAKYISQIIELELYAEPDPLEKRVFSQNFGSLPYASVLRSGIVRLALDGESKEGLVVQSNDSRLKPATTDSKGIVELASDGEDREGVVVQGNDRRLKYASEDFAGIVRFARNREQRPLYAVQSNDDRLKPATIDSKGIVELAEPGEDREGVVVQGNDPRLKISTENSYGIVKLAKLGESQAGLVLQSNDPRIKEGTTESKGIVRLARLGENSPDCAVQGNDPRLREATTHYKGIVELAEPGEDREGVVVQGNDPRLKISTENSYGIVRLCKKGESIPGTVVQGDDPRLSDPRKPLPHEHDYAPRKHSFDSHEGNLYLEKEMGKDYNETIPPNFDYAPIYGVNRGEGSGLAGRGRIRGILGYGDREGVTGFSVKGWGVFAKSFQGTGGQFFSEKGFDLILGNLNLNEVLKFFEKEERVIIDRNSLLVQGKGYFLNQIFYLQKNKFQVPIAIEFPVAEKDTYLVGDLIVPSVKEGMVQKSHHRKSTKVIGVCVEDAAMVLTSNIKDKMESRPSLETILVAFFGVVPMRVSTEAGAIEPGDLLVSSLHSGCAEKLTGKDSFEPSIIVGKSLGYVKKGIQVIPVLLR